MTPGTVSVGFLHPGAWQSCFASSLIDMLFFDAYGPQRIVSHPHGRMAVETGAGQIVAGRNDLARKFLDVTDAEWLFMVDADTGFAPDTVERLVAAADPVDRPVVGALAFAMKSDGAGEFFARRYRATPTVYRAATVDGKVGFAPMFDYPPGRVVRVDATGTACVLIHRSALVAIRDAYGDRWFDPIEVPTGSAGRTVFGEDLSFCLRLTACGLLVHVDTSVRTTHDKGGVFLDEDTYRLQQAMMSLRTPPSPCIDVIVPTFGRADRLAGVAANIAAATANLARITFVVEADDVASIEAVEALASPTVRLAVNRKERSYAGAVNTAFEACDSAWLFTGADDLRFHPGWDVEALALAASTSAKVVGTNDLWNRAVLAGEHSTHSLVAADYVRDVGATFDVAPGRVLYPYHHNYVDTELVAAARRRGVYAHCHAARVEHLHPFAGKAEMDATYEHGLSRSDDDRAVFLERMGAQR